jgi:hypothetical protein
MKDLLAQAMAFFALLLLSCLNQTQVSAQQEPIALADKEGTWEYIYLDDGNTKMYCQNFGMTPKEISEFKLKMDQLVNILHKNPVMQNPRGFDADVQSRPYYPHSFKKHAVNYGYIAEINFRLPEWYESKGRVYKQTIEPPRTTIYFNNLEILRHAAFSYAEEGNPRETARISDVCKPMVIKKIAPGVVLYDYAIVFTRPDKHLFLPCSVEEAYTRLIDYYESAAENQPMFEYLLGPVKEEYSRLAPDKLKLPAFFGGPNGITWQPNADTLMIFNNDFFDRTVPKTKVQAIVFPIDADYFRKQSDYLPNSVGSKRINQFLHTLDYSAISAVLD